MREVGLLDVTTDARGEVGRPQHRYSLAADAPSLGLEPPTDADAGPPGAGDGPAASAPARPTPSPSARPKGAPEPPPTPTRRRPSRRSSPTSTASASTRSSPRSPAATRRTASTSTLDDDVTAVVAFANCPFADVARAHPELVCALHRGLVAGFVEQMGDAEVRGVLHARRPHALPGVGRQPVTGLLAVIVNRALSASVLAPRRNVVITLTESAAVKVKELLAAEGAEDLALRVAVRPGGCSGFSYEMFFDGDIAADDEQAKFGPDETVKVVVDPAVGPAPRRRHARLQGRPRAVRVRHHEPQRHPHLRLRPELLLTRRALRSGRARSQCSFWARTFSRSRRGAPSSWSQKPGSGPACPMA